MVFDELLSVMPVPSNVVEGGLGQDWGRVTGRFCDPLPTDYMQFIDTYGSGSVNGFLTVFNPFSANFHVNLFDQVLFTLSSLRALKAQFPREVPFPLYFEPGGMLPWGMSIDGDIYCWLTNGISGGWQTVVICRHAPAGHFKMTMTQFLARAIKGEIKSYSIPEDFGDGGCGVFYPLEKT